MGGSRPEEGSGIPACGKSASSRSARRHTPRVPARSPTPRTTASARQPARRAASQPPLKRCIVLPSPVCTIKPSPRRGWGGRSLREEQHVVDGAPHARGGLVHGHDHLRPKRGHARGTFSTTELSWRGARARSSLRGATVRPSRASAPRTTIMRTMQLRTAGRMTLRAPFGCEHSHRF